MISYLTGPGMVSFNSTSQDGLLVGMSDFVQCIPAMEQGIYRNIVTTQSLPTAGRFSILILMLFTALVFIPLPLP